MKLLAISACVLVLFSGVALSQENAAGENANTVAEKLDATRARTEREQRKQQELDAAYKATLAKKKPPAPVDPWGVVRPAK
jgi:hypothetical protein